MSFPNYDPKQTPWSKRSAAKKNFVESGGAQSQYDKFLDYLEKSGPTSIIRKKLTKKREDKNGNKSS